jgi:glycosyltransferase involved in cell wall biosynthesis
MRVILVTPSYFPIIGGSETLTHILSTKLNEQGIHSDIMTLNMDEKWNPKWRAASAKNGLSHVFKEPAVNPFPNLPNPMFNLLRMNVTPTLGFLKKLKRYDIIHFIGEADMGFPLLSFFLKKPKLLQCVGIFRKGGIYKYYMNDRAFLGRTFNKFLARVADSFVISSDEEKELLLEMGVPASKVTVLPIGIDTEVFRPNQGKKTDNLVLFVGRISKIKGLHNLISALSYAEIPVNLAVVGPKWDLEYSLEIEEMAEKINEGGFHRVTFLGSKGQSDLISCYQEAAVLVCPYLYETHSNVVREALACGTPVLSTGSHLVEGRPDGIVLMPNEPKEIADALTELLKDKHLRDKLGREGRDTIEQHCSWKNIITDLVRLYQELLAG